MNTVFIDRIIAIGVCILAGLVLLTAWNMPGGSAGFPIAAAVVCIASSVLVLVSRDKSPGNNNHSEPPVSWKRFIFWLACIVFFLVGWNSLGTLICLVAFLWLSFSYLSVMRWWGSGLLAVVFALVVYLVFAHLLGVPLPEGTLFAH